MANEIGDVIVLNSGNSSAAIKGTDAKNPNSLVRIYLDGVAYSVVTDATGAWSFTPAGGWDEGRHVVSIEIVDRAGNVGTPKFEIVNIDLTDPAKPEIFRVIAGNDYLTPGEATGEKMPEISGVADPNGIVYLYGGANGDTLIGSTKANAMGAWTITPNLTDGKHTLNVKVKDAANRESESSDSFVVDIANGVVTHAVKHVTETAETAEIATQAAEIQAGESGTSSLLQPLPVYKDSIAISAKTTAGNLVQVLFNNAVYTIIADAEGKWSYKAEDLSEGTYIAQFRYQDRAGNWGPVQQLLFEVMPQEPEAPQIMRVVDDEGGLDYLTPYNYTNDKTPTLSGVAMPGSTVHIFDNNIEVGTVVAGPDGRWTMTVSLNENLITHNLTANYVDVHGKTSKTSEIFNLSLDLTTPTKPEISEVLDDEGRVTGPLNSGDTTDDTTPTFKGIADAGTLVRIWNGTELLGSAVADSRGKWEIELQLTDGETYNLVVDSVAKGGNVSEQTDPFTLKIDASVLPPAEIGGVYNNNDSQLVEITNGAQTNDKTPLLKGTGNDGDIVRLFVDDKLVGTVIVVDGKWEIETDELSEDTHELKVEIETPDGKVSPPSDPYIVVVDVTAPDKPEKPEKIIDDEGDVQGEIAEGKPTDDKTPTIGGSGAEPGDTVELVIIDENGNAGPAIGTAIVDENGNWTVTPGQELDNGEYDLGVVITDPAGNKSEPSDPIKVIIDDTKPADLTNFDLYDDVGPEQGIITAGGITDDKNPTLKGTAAPGTSVEIVLNGNVIGTATTGSDGKWNYEFTNLSDASYTFALRPISEAGVKGDMTAPISFIVDTTPPTAGTFDGVFENNKGSEQLVPVVGGERLTNDGDLILKGTGVAGDIVIIYSDAAKTQEIGRTTVDAQGNWRFETSELVQDGEDKTIHLSVAIRDAAGNQLDIPTSYDIHIDREAPEIPDVGISSFGEVEDLQDLAFSDVMALNSEGLFIDNGKTQLVITGNEGDEVKLEDILPEGEDIANWSQANGTVTVAGVEYNVYQNTAGDAEVLVQNNLQVEQH